jgi:hypothetical protein
LLPRNHLLLGVDPVNLKYVLGDIQTDRGNLHLDGSPYVIRLQRSLSSLQVFHRNFAVWVSALEELRRRNRNGFDVAIGARLAVNEDFELSAGWISNLHLPQSSSASRFTAQDTSFAFCGSIATARLIMPRG